VSDFLRCEKCGGDLYFAPPDGGLFHVDGPCAASRVDPEPEPAFRVLALCPDCPHGCPEPRCAECAGSGDVIVSEPG
jgi:hypothetical protein